MLIDKSFNSKFYSIMSELGLSTYWSIDYLSKAIQEKRRKNLIVKSLNYIPSDFSHDICGIWIGTDKSDYVFIRKSINRIHQEHIFLHELAHIILDHPGTSMIGYAKFLLPHLNEKLIERVLARGILTNEQEEEAENLALYLRMQLSKTDLYQQPVLDRAVEAFTL